jgi:hypothetical protein
MHTYLSSGPLCNNSLKKTYQCLSYQIHQREKSQAAYSDYLLLGLFADLYFLSLLYGGGGGSDHDVVVYSFKKRWVRW